MARNLIIYIFIYILSVGCDRVCYINCPDIDMEMEDSEECLFESYLELGALDPRMILDENGYYNFQLNYGLTGAYTHTILDADVGLQYHMIHWESDTQFNLPWQGTDNWSDVVNNTSYTGQDGIGHTVLGAWEELVGDTITVTCNYSYCDSVYSNIMRVIIE